MKTMFVVSEKKTDEHVGEEYDYILEVADQPTTAGIQEDANRIRNRIRSLWMEQTEAKEPNPQVSVKLHGASPYNAMLINLKIMMMEEENIEIVLDYPHEEVRTTDDEETNEVLNKLDKRV